MSTSAHAPVQVQPLRVQVAEEVRVAMARRRISGVALANRLGKAQPWISRRLRGDVAFDLDDLEAVASALDVPVETLLGLDHRSGTSRYRTSPDSGDVTKITGNESDNVTHLADYRHRTSVHRPAESDRSLASVSA